MTNVVAFQADNSDQDTCIDILEAALAKAKAGEMVDVAVIGAIRDENGPQFWTSYYGGGSYATILAGVSALEFDLHHERYVEAGKT
jgi:hypothetical protein